MAEPIIIVNHPQEVGPSSNQGLAKISHLPRTNEYGMLSVFLLYEWWKYCGILMLVLQLRLVMQGLKSSFLQFSGLHMERNPIQAMCLRNTSKEISLLLDLTQIVRYWPLNFNMMLKWDKALKGLGEGANIWIV